MYLLTTIEVLRDEPIPDFYFQEMFVLVEAATGPYAISFFLKANKENYLSAKNKDEIEREYELYRKENCFFRLDNDDIDELQNFDERSRLIQSNIQLESYHSTA